MKVWSDEDIVSAVRQNPEKGFRMLMAKYREAVYWHIRRLVISHADAQDAAQETFVRIFRSFSQFRGECSFAAWIYRIGPMKPCVCWGVAAADGYLWTIRIRERAI